LAKTKTASVRLPKEMYEEIDNICDGIGCSRNDWIKDTLQDKLREENNENSQDQEVIKDTKPKEPTPTIGTIETTNDGSKYKLKSIQDNGVQVWLQIEEPKELENVKVI